MTLKIRGQLGMALQFLGNIRFWYSSKNAAYKLPGDQDEDQVFRAT